VSHLLHLLRELGLLVVGAAAAVAVFVGLLVLLQWLVGVTNSRSRRRTSSGSSDASRLRGRMQRLARQTLLLAPATAAEFSKLGGEPDLPPGMAWPELRGRPCAFLAQIDLAAVQLHAQLDWLPEAGRFYAFVDLEGYGFADQVQARFHAGPPGEARPAPTRGLQFPERRVAFGRCTSLPSLDWLGVDLAKTDLGEDELDELSDLPDAPFGDEIQHRIGGYPSELQDEQMAVACELLRRGLPPVHEGTEITAAISRASKAWRLLLQVDSDPALRMNWGDGGRLYVFIREQDAKAGDFSRTITLSQTY
jgi:uncharacterized protein YwqG